MAPAFFPTPADFRAWLATHHASETELSVGFYKIGLQLFASGGMELARALKAEERGK